MELGSNFLSGLFIAGLFLVKVWLLVVWVNYVGEEAQKEYKIAVIPTIVIFKDGDEVARFQADLSFKMVATREEVQEEISNQLMSDF